MLQQEQLICQHDRRTSPEPDVEHSTGMKALLTLREYLLKDRWYLAAGFICLIIVDLLQLIIPLVIKSAVDGLTGGAATQAALLDHALVIAGIGIAAAALRFCWRYCIIGSSRRVEAALRNRLFYHVINLPLARLLQSKTGDFMARMTNDLDAVRMCTGIGTVALIDTVVLGAASIMFMAFLNIRLMALCLAPMLVIVLATWRLGKKLHARFSRVQAAFSQMTEMIRETLAGIAVIRAFDREQDTARRFSQVSSEYVEKNLALVKIWGSLFPFIIFISNISVCILIFFGGRATIAGSISAGDFVAFASYIWILIWPMMALGWIVNLFQRGAASMSRINDVLAMPSEPSGRGMPEQPVGANRSIGISSLTFSYGPDTPPVLTDIALTIAAGDTIGITGTTGSGKSTLCSLLLRFFDPPRGAIFINNRDICDISLAELRRSVAYVPQDSFLFSATILENILFGRPDASETEARTQAGISRITEEIESFSNGFSTLVGEKGITLSGGQKQRLCIARALLMQAPILIFDDALSSLDAATTQSLIRELKAQDRGQTRILVSNRIASIQHADRIYVMDKGKIEARGTHAELLAGRGLYYQLYQRQRLEDAGPGMQA